MHLAISNVLFGLVLALLGASSSAHADMTGEKAYLAGIEGQWSGTGSVRLLPGTAAITVSCTLSGDANAGGADLNGQCSGLLLSTSVNARLQFNYKTNSYFGSWSTNKNSANLSGLRRGSGLSLAVSELNEPARVLTISLSRHGLKLVMTRVDDGSAVMKLALRRS